MKHRIKVDDIIVIEAHDAVPLEYQVKNWEFSFTDNTMVIKSKPVTYDDTSTL
jgi:hypothetical protein